jgi:hypothetical protein
VLGPKGIFGDGEEASAVKLAGRGCGNGSIPSFAAHEDSERGISDPHGAMVVLSTCQGRDEYHRECPRRTSLSVPKADRVALTSISAGSNVDGRRVPCAACEEGPRESVGGLE